MNSRSNSNDRNGEGTPPSQADPKGQRPPTRVSDTIPRAQPPASEPPLDRPTPLPSSHRRARANELGRRTPTLKIRPWSQLPGVRAYLVMNELGEVMDAWASMSDEAVLRAQTFRQRVVRGSFDGGQVLETLTDSRLLSVVRPDDWFVHVELEPDTDVAGILAILGGR